MNQCCEGVQLILKNELRAVERRLEECVRKMSYSACILRGQVTLIEKDQGTDVDKDTMIKRVADILDPPVVERKTMTNRERLERIRLPK